MAVGGHFTHKEPLATLELPYRTEGICNAQEQIFNKLTANFDVNKWNVQQPPVNLHRSAVTSFL